MKLVVMALLECLRNDVDLVLGVLDSHVRREMVEVETATVAFGHFEHGTSISSKDWYVEDQKMRPSIWL